MPRTIKAAALEDQAIASLAALAQRQRLRAFRALVVAGPQGMTAGEIAAALDLSPSALSFHLKELAHAQLVDVEPQGRNMLYRARFDTMNGLLDYLTEHCCAGQACMPPRAAKRGC
ncbi:metalloregulator ArsR/SmtB family transcription factor [Hydrogenophaga sp. 5NK40-0174]|uniref:ArsR/SmtB family transcription factor n=1 Tax=Hydrogenophaga sp. 5NK40-0174 TaxID=3127649 RepID=UPI00310A3A8C